MPHVLEIDKESHLGLKKRLYDVGYQHGLKEWSPKERISTYYMKGFSDGKKEAEKNKQEDTIDDWV